MYLQLEIDLLKLNENERRETLVAIFAEIQKIKNEQDIIIEEVTFLNQKREIQITETGQKMTFDEEELASRKQKIELQERAITD